MSYGRHISGLWLCETADFATNDLPTAPTETFTATKVVKQMRGSAPANYASAVYWDLSSWTSIRGIYLANTGSADIEIDWKSPWTDGTSSGAIKTFAFVSAGRSITIPSAQPTNDVFGNGSVPGSIALYGVHLTIASTFAIIVLGT